MSKSSSRNPVYDKSQKKWITIRQALRRNIKENEGNFEIRLNRIIAYHRRQRKYVEATPQQANEGLRNGNFELYQMIGVQNYDETTGIIGRPTITRRQKDRIANRPVVRKILGAQDREDPFMLYNFLRENNVKGKGQFIVAQNGRTIFNKELDIGNNLHKWWRDEGGIFIGLVDSDTYIWFLADLTQEAGRNERDYLYVINRHGSKNWTDWTIEEKPTTRRRRNVMNKTTTIIYWVPDTKLPIPTAPQNIYQTFRDNEDNSCFFKGIEQFITAKMEEKSAYRTKDRYKALTNKVNKLKTLYPNGVPEEKIQEIADTLRISFEIRDMFNSLFITVRPDKKPLTTIRYYNTKENHVEIDKYIGNLNNKIEVESAQELTDMIVEKLQKGEFFYYLGTLFKPSIVFTQDASYTYKSDQNKIIDKFNKENRLYDYSIDYRSKLATYIEAGVNYNTHCSFPEMKKYTAKHIEENFIEYDMKQAYKQYRNAPHYLGFPTILTPPVKLYNWNVSKCKKYVGYYQVKITGYKNQNTKNILDIMGLSTGVHYLLTSPEILLFDMYGTIFEFISGSYSYKTIDIELTEEMLENRNYCVWAGKLNSHNETTSRKTICSRSLADILSTKYDSVSINEYPKGLSDIGFDSKVECKVEYKNEKVPWLGHIGGYITAYTRTNVLVHMLKLQPEDIIGYKLDGFITKKPIEYLPPSIWHTGENLKPTKAKFDWGFSIYSSCFENLECLDLPLFNERVTFLSGEGGTGKSHTILSNMDAFYVSACWRLNAEKTKEYGCQSLTIHQMLGKGCQSYLNRNAPPPILFIDELTQIHKEWITDLINKCPYSIIYIAGDIDKDGDFYQCKFKDVEPIDDFTNMDFVKFETNYRCKDNRFLEELRGLRDVMKKSKFNTSTIGKYVTETLKDRIIDKETLTKIYNTETDWVICSTTDAENSQTDYYTKTLKGNKYLCVKHSAEHIYQRLQGKEIALKGDIKRGEITEKRYEKREAFTIHSFQGITIKNPDRLFIDLNRIFSPRQLYTALSRAEYREQVYLII